MFTYGDLTIELHHLSTSHAREMVFAYIPKARVNAATAEFAAAIDLRNRSSR